MLAAEPSSHNGPSFLVAGRGSYAHLWQQRHGSKGPSSFALGYVVGRVLRCYMEERPLVGGGIGVGIGVSLLESHYPEPSKGCWSLAWCL